MIKLSGKWSDLPEILRPEDIASSLRVTLYFVLGFSAYGLVSALRSQESAWNSVAINSILLVIASSSALWLLHAKKATLAVYVALVSNALVLVYAAWTGAGVNGVSYAGLILPVLAAALFLGARAGYTSAFVATLVGAFLFMAGRMGWLVNIDRPVTPIVAWLANLLFFFVAAHLIAVSLRQVERALGKAHDEIRERTRTEAEIRRLNGELEQRIAERTHQLAESEERYRLIAENADDIIWTTDMSLHITYISPSLQRALGYQTDELSRLTPEQALTPASLQNALQIFQEEVAHAHPVPDSGYVRTFELEFRRKDGTTFWAETKFAFLRDISFHLTGVLAVGRDVTERKQMEATLRASEERYRLISSISSDYMFSTMVDADGILRLNWVAGAFEKITGYTQEEYEAHGGWRSTVHSSDLTVDDHDFEKLSANQPVVTELRTFTKSGQICWVRVYAHPVWDAEHDRLAGIYGAVQDISERKQTEEALREAELRYRTLVEQTSVVIYRDLPDLEATALYMSPQIEKLVGYSADEWMNQPLFWQSLLHPDDRARVMADVAKYIETEEVSSIEYRMRARNGQWVWVRDEVALVRDSEGQPIFVQGVLSNITERKEAEEALRASEQRFRALVEQLPAITYTDDVNKLGRTIYISPQLESALGYTPGEWIEGELDFWVTHIHPDDRERTEKEFEACFYHGTPVDSEYRMFARDGHLVWFHDRAVRLNNADGQPLFIQGVMTNITERKRAEHQLEQQASQLAVLHQLGQDVVASLDLEQVYVSTHRAVEQLIPTEAFYISLLDDERQEIHYAYLFDSGQRWPSENQPVNAPGLTSHVIQTGEPLFIKDDSDHISLLLGATSFGTQEDTRSIMIAPLKFGGKVIGTISAQHYQPEMYTSAHFKLLTMLANQVAIAIQNARLVESLRLQTVALNAAANAIVITDRNNIIQWVNPAFTTLTGYTAADAIGRNPNLLRSGKHADVFYQHMWQTLNEGRVWHGEIINRRKDGSFYTEEQIITPVRDGRGEVFRYIAVKQDISERKKAEEALRSSETRFRQLIASAPDAIIGVNQDGTILLANMQATELFGYQTDELIGRNVDMLLPEGVQTIHSTHRAGYIASPRTRPMGTGMELHARRKDGSEFAVEISLSHLDTDAGLLITAFVRDITERKKAQMEIQRQRDFALQVMNAMGQGLAVSNRDRLFEYVNPAAAQMLGYEPKDLIGRQSLDMMVSEEVSKLEEAHAQRKLGKASTYETRLQHANGKSVDVIITGVPRWENGTYSGAITVITDLTERKQVEEREKRRRAMLEKVVDLGKAVTQITDLQLCLRAIHQSVQKGLGFDRVGLFLYDVETHLLRGTFGTDRRGEIEDTSWFSQAIHEYDAWQKALSDPKGISVIEDYEDVHHVESDNEMKGVSQHVTLASWVGDKPVALIAADNVITQERVSQEQLEALQLFAGYAGLAIENARWNDELEQRVAERTTELEAANQELESLSYTIAHDMRSPVRAMVGYSRLLEQSHSAQLDSDGLAQLQNIHTEAKRMGQLVDDFLAFLRLGRKQIQTQLIDVNRLVERIIKYTQAQITGRHLEFVIGNLSNCHADPELIEQVWSHLIANAIKFTQTRDIAHIEIGSKEMEGESCYFIRDNGIGFDMRFAEKLFQVFQRLNRQEQFEGTGMGLAIVHRILQRHGGRIWAEAEVDKGATFYFTL